MAARVGGIMRSISGTAAIIISLASALFAGGALYETHEMRLVTHQDNEHMLASQRDMVASQRAYVAAETVTIGELAINRTAFKLPVTLQMRVFGASPANNPRLKMSCSFTGLNVPIPNSLIPDNPIVQLPQSMLPGASQTINCDPLQWAIIQPDYVKDFTFALNLYHLLVSGVITYQDVLGNTHHTAFCFEKQIDFIVPGRLMFDLSCPLEVKSD